MTLRVFFVVCVVAVLSACGKKACDSSSCTGCCDASGECITATTQVACGTQGNSCQQCQLGQLCIAGFCSMQSTGSGGGSGATGGGSASNGGGGGGPSTVETASLRLFWEIPQGSNVTCSTASLVDIWINGARETAVTCASGSSAGSGVELAQVPAGEVNVVVAARDVNDFYFYRNEFQLTLAPGGSVSNTLTFEWAVGSLPLRWSFSNGGAALSCAEANVSSVFLNLTYSDGASVYPGEGIEVPCQDTSGYEGTLFPYLYGDTYGVIVQAYDAQNRLYSTAAQPPTVSVTNGQFPVVSGSTPVVLLSL